MKRELRSINLRMKCFLLASVPFFLIGCTIATSKYSRPRSPARANQLDEPPLAKSIPYKIDSPNGARLDHYYWLRDDTRSDPEVLGYLMKENDYTDAVLSTSRLKEEAIFAELKSRIEQKYESVPKFDSGYWYYYRYMKNQEYPIYVRRKGNMDAPEEVLLDTNKLAKGKSYYQVGAIRVSPNGHLMAFTFDTVGRFQYSIHVLDLKTGEMIDDSIKGVVPSIVWLNDNSTILYTQNDPVTLRSRWVKKHLLGTSTKDDSIVYEEKDVTFNVGVTRSKSKRFIFIYSYQTLSSEWRYAEASDPSLRFEVLCPRKRNHEYNVEHVGEHFLVRTNWNAENFRIVKVPIAKNQSPDKWKDLVKHRPDAFVHGFDVFRNFVAISERSKGQRNIQVIRLDGSHASFIDADEPAYALYLSSTPDFDSEVMYYSYRSLVSPQAVFEYNFTTGERILLKQNKVMGGFDSNNYASEYIWVTARDGAKIPVSLVYRKNFERDGTAPLYQIGYGSYGYSMDPTFSSTVISLLDRGFVYAIAHIRGGQELGRQWYENGKLLKKKNSFRDFIDVTEYLAENSYVSTKKVFARGGSAGGLLMGAVANMRPDLYRGIIAHVPFVDVVTTMLDNNIPLTSGEYDEWGDPKQKAYFDYILSYSPYDNVKAQEYPSLFVTTGLWDSQVQYFEPAKWVAKLRALKTDKNLIMLWTNMKAGHGGNSGRFRRLKDRAKEYTFVFHVLGLDE